MMQTSSTPPPRVLRTAMIVDDHPLFCDALSLTLRAVGGITQIEAVDTLAGALNALSAGATPPPDIIVLDLNLPDVTGLDGLIRLHRAAGPIPVVVVSSMADNRMIASALRAGAAGFVPKHSQREVFARAFDAIRNHATFLPDGYVDLSDSSEPASEREDAIERLSLLTAQQARILELICAGKLNKQIAFTLSIAEATVKAHVTAIMRKLGVQSRTQAVLIAQHAHFANFLPNEHPED